MKKILIALDNHTNYQVVSTAGYELARALGASVALLHVYPDTLVTSPDAFSSLYGTVGSFDVAGGIGLEKELSEQSLNFLEKVKTEHDDMGAELFTGEGNVAEAILDTATDCNADIIVLGKHSRTGIDHILMGSAAKEVLQRTTLPLYIIPVG